MPNSPKARATRRYDSSGRQARAATSRRRILDQAHDLFVADGYGSTTIAAIAEAAEVSAPTVYAAFGTKAELLRRVIEVAVAGDEQEVPVVERPIARWVEEADTAEEVLARYAVMMGDLGQRAAPVYDVLARAADAEPELVELAERFEVQRLSGADRIAGYVQARGGLPPGRTRASVRDLIWLCNAPEQYTLLVTKRGWSQARYVAWATDALLRLLQPPLEHPAP
jgi:AcrR family transcriptional regulator